MTLTELADLLKSTGIPVTYYAWPENQAPQLPFICYLTPGSNNFAADGLVYYPITQVNVELYTKIKSPETEAKVEGALASIFWDKSETYIDSEKCYQIVYEIEV